MKDTCENVTVINNDNKIMDLDIEVNKKLNNVIDFDDSVVYYFDIVIINNSDYKVDKLSLRDSIMGLRYIYKQISFDAISENDNLEIEIVDDEILENISYLMPKSTSRMRLKITIDKEFDYENDKYITNIKLGDSLACLTGIILKYNEDTYEYDEYQLNPIIS